MHGLSPVNHSLSLKQTQLSAEIAESVPDLPTTLSDLISQMALPDFSVATQELELDGDGMVIQNSSNLDIVAHIELALTSPSSECAPLYKAQIFYTASEACLNGRKIRPYLVQIIDGLKTRGMQINLDDVTLCNLDMSQSGNLDLIGMSARHARFYGINLNYANLESSDFTGAIFNDVHLRWASLSKAIVTDAQFSDVECQGTEASELTANQSEIFNCRKLDQSMMLVDDVPYSFDNIILESAKLTANPDTDTFILPEKFNITRYRD